MQGAEEVETLGVTVGTDWTFVNASDSDSDESGSLTFAVHGNSALALWASLQVSNEMPEDLVDWVCNNLREADNTGVRKTLKAN